MGGMTCELVGSAVAMKWKPSVSNKFASDSGAMDSGALDSGVTGISTKSGDLSLATDGVGDGTSTDSAEIAPLPDGVGVGVWIWKLVLTLGNKKIE